MKGRRLLELCLIILSFYNFVLLLFVFLKNNRLRVWSFGFLFGKMLVRLKEVLPSSGDSYLRSTFTLVKNFALLIKDVDEGSAQAFSEVQASSFEKFTRAEHSGRQCWDKRPEQVRE
jgi:hypothetical protein